MKYLLILLCVLSINSQACTSYMIGFRGDQGQFDQLAFREFADRYTDCNKVFNHTDITMAIQFINLIQVSYELYGYSAGASSIKHVLTRVNRFPRYIITIGALSSTDVDFTNTEINFDNFFDPSGRGTRSPGIHVNVSHSQIQRYVTDFFTK